MHELEAGNTKCMGVKGRIMKYMGEYYGGKYGYE